MPRIRLSVALLSTGTRGIMGGQGTPGDAHGEKGDTTRDQSG